LVYHLEEVILENKNEALRENGMLFLLAISPVVIGFFYYVMVQIPVIGTIWMYAAPFTVLYYWGWVATVFRSRFQSFFKTIGWMNLFGLLMYLIFIWQYAFMGEEKQISILAVFSQLYTVSLGFITMWLGILIDGSSAVETETISVAATVVTETFSMLLLLISSVIGYFIGKGQEKKRTEKEAETKEPEKTEEIEPIFSDRQLEDYELKDEEEALKKENETNS